ncbi:YafY family transcriptional regulator [Nocardia colli]|uniref:YafY family transcriptional regulator n=1 Tax=Nocardia colli TaxID=2545717 RepID=A0A5N0ELA0_9NOCA|nr:YafY family protein [Nocardia colli]KAA8890178.1 YafY family transcriptional regulator [Nocardia colli]
MRASRLLSIMLLLQARGRMTAEQLARELEVSVRTVYRDVESLSLAGVPLYGEAGHDGGYRLVDGYRTRLTGLTADEAEALFLAGLPGPAADLGLGAVLATAQLKLKAALPDELSEGVGRVQQRFHLDTSEWYADPDSTAQLAAVVDATWTQRRIRIRYRRWAQPREVDREVAPYGLVLKSGRWYLVAESDSIRTYRVAQILRIQLLDSTFERPTGFDLATCWADYLDDFDARRYRGTARIRLTKRALERLPHLLEPALVRAARDSAEPADSTGRVIVMMPMETIEHTAGLLLRFGVDAEVLAPAELRDRMAVIAVGLADIYRAGSKAAVTAPR